MEGQSWGPFSSSLGPWDTGFAGPSPRTSPLPPAEGGCSSGVTVVTLMAPMGFLLLAAGLGVLQPKTQFSWDTAGLSGPEQPHLELPTPLKPHLSPS